MTTRRGFMKGLGAMLAGGTAAAAMSPSGLLTLPPEPAPPEPACATTTGRQRAMFLGKGADVPQCHEFDGVDWQPVEAMERDR